MSRDAGYDGEYGVIRLFQPDELDGTALFAATGLTVPDGKDHDCAERSMVPAAATQARGRRDGAAPAAAPLGRPPVPCWTAWTRTSTPRPPPKGRC